MEKQRTIDEKEIYQYFFNQCVPCLSWAETNGIKYPIATKYKLISFQLANKKVTSVEDLSTQLTKIKGFYGLVVKIDKGFRVKLYDSDVGGNLSVSVYEVKDSIILELEPTVDSLSNNLWKLYRYLKNKYDRKIRRVEKKEES